MENFKEHAVTNMFSFEQFYDLQRISMLWYAIEVAIKSYYTDIQLRFGNFCLFNTAYQFSILCFHLFLFKNITERTERLFLNVFLFIYIFFATHFV